MWFANIFGSGIPRDKEEREKDKEFVHINKPRFGKTLDNTNKWRTDTIFSDTPDSPYEIWKKKEKYREIIEKAKKTKAWPSKSKDSWYYEESFKKLNEIIITKEDKQFLDEYKEILQDINKDEMIKEAWEKFLMFRKLRKSNNT